MVIPLTHEPVWWDGLVGVVGPLAVVVVVVVIRTHGVGALVVTGWMEGGVEGVVTGEGSCRHQFQDGRRWWRCSHIV